MKDGREVKYFDNMSDYFQYLKKQSLEDRRKYMAYNVDEFVSNLMRKDHGELEHYYLQKFICHMKMGNAASDRISDDQKYGMLSPAIKRLIEKTGDTPFVSSGVSKEELKSLVFNNVNTNPQEQQEFAARQVLKFCQRFSEENKSYGAIDTAKLAEGIAQILNPIANEDKKTLKSIKNISSTIARESISIMSVNQETQLNAWQKFLHVTIDKLKIMFAAEKIHNVVQGKAFKNITEVKDGKRVVKPMATPLSKENKGVSISR